MSALGSLVVKLALQHAEFTGGLDKSEQAALAAAKRIQDTFDGMKARIASTAGAIAGGLAAGFTVAAFKGLISGAIETGAALDDLRQQTGATVESLSGMLAVGKFNDVGPEQLGAAMNKLASNLAGATEESKGTGKALAALGINIDDFRKLKPEEQMQQVAKAMGDVEDGAGKSAVAMALYGKEGAKMIPFFNDLASVGELQAKMTTEQAAAAANLDDNLKRLSTSGDGWKKELANGMIPALDQGAQALLDVMNGTGGLREKIKGLAADGSIKEWTRNAIMGFSYVADVVQGLVSLVPIAGKALGGLFATLGTVVGSVFAAFQKITAGDLGGAMDELEGGLARVKTVGVETWQDIKGVWNQELIGTRLRERMNELETSTAGAGDAAEGAHKKQLTFANAVEKTGKAAAEAKDPVAALLDTIGKRAAAYAGELAAGEKLTEGEKTAVEVLDQLRTGKVKVTEAEAELIGKRLESMLVLEQQVTLHHEELKQLEAQRAERIKLYQSVEQGVTTLAEQNKSLKEEIELIGLSDAAQLSVIRGRNNQTIATKQAALAELELQAARTGTMSREQIALQQEIELLQERNALLGQQFDAKQVEKQSAAWMEMWNSVDRTAHDVFVDVANNGMSAFKRVGKTLQASVLDMLYQMTLRKWIFQILASVTGSVGATAASAATAAGGVANAASGLGMLGNLGSGIAGLVGNTVGAIFGTGVGNVALGTTLGLGASSSAAAASAAAAAGGASAASAAGIASAGNLFGSISTAMPWLAGAAALMAIVSSLDDSGTYHTGGAAQYSAAQGLQAGQSGEGFGIGVGRVEAGAETIAAVGSLAQGLGQSLDGLAQAFGQQGGFRVGTSYADDSSKDRAWGGLGIWRDGQELANWNNNRESKWAPREFDDGEAGYKQFLAAVAKDSRDVVIQAIDLPRWAKDMLQALGDAPSMDAFTGALQQIGVVQAGFVALGKSMAMFSGLSGEMQTALLAAAGSMDVLTGNASTFYQAYYSEGERMQAAVAQLDTALAGFGLDIDPTMGEEAKRKFREAVEGAMAAGDAKAAAGLLAISGNFAQAADYFEQLSQTAADQVGDAAAQAKDFAKEQVRSAQDAAKAIREAYAGALSELSSARFDLENQLLQQAGQGSLVQQRKDAAELAKLVDGLPADMAAKVREQFEANLKLREQYDANQAAIDAFRASMEKLEEEQNAATEAQRQMLQGTVTSAQRAVTGLQSIFTMLDSSIEALRGSVKSSAEQDAKSAREYIARATVLMRSGTVVDSGKLQAAIRAATAGIENRVYANETDADFERLKLAGELAGLQDSTAGQLTVAEQHLSIAQKQLDALQTINLSINSLASAQAAAAGVKKEQWSSVNGGTIWASGGGAVGVKNGNDIDIFGADGSKFTGSEAIAFVRNQLALNNEASVYAAAVKAGISAQSLDALMDWAPGTANDWATLNGLPRFELGGDHAGGLRLVGERGWEVEATGSARYWNQSQLATAMRSSSDQGTAEVVRELRQLRKTVESQQNDIAKLRQACEWQAEMLYRVSRNGNALITEAAPA